ncbi:MAG: hypothetical protein K2J42_10255 [Muribaculaceae bacterium]|nr:hypothetical protein [Muribaculaceae bacterium]
MKSFSSLIIGIVIMTLIGCQNNATNNLIENPNEINEANTKVKDYVDNNTYIDVDVQALVKKTTAQDSRSNITEDDNAKMKAAVYRFYKHVSVKDSLYILDIQDASEINISTRVFTALAENLKEMNDFIKLAKEKGENIDLFIPDEEYLNSLLQ